MADAGDQEPPVDTATVEAVGKLTEALETTEIARGHLYAFHQLTGSADFKVEEAIDLLACAGHRDLAARLERELLGRNVLAGRWTFQVVEEYDDTYYNLFRELERETRKLTGGHRHLYETGLKRERRTPGEPGHEATPQEPAIPPRSDDGGGQDQQGDQVGGGLTRAAGGCPRPHGQK